MRAGSSHKLVVLVGAVVLVAGVMFGDAAAADDVAPGEEWTGQFGTIEDDYGYGVAVDATGATYVAGTTHGALPGRTSHGEADVFVRKHDSTGNVQWTRQFGTDAFDHGYAVAVDTSGAYVVGSAAALPGQSTAGVFVRKYDPTGGHLWTRQFGTGSGNDQGYGVAVDASGVYVTGVTGGTLPGQTNAGQDDAFVRAYDHQGNERWTRQFGTASSDEGYAVAADVSGVYVTGSTKGAFPGEVTQSDGDVFVRKYDHEGNEAWTSQSGDGEHSRSEGRGVAVDATGVYVTGKTYSVWPGLTGFNYTFVDRYDLLGNQLWHRWFPTSADRDNAGRGVALDASGVYVTGWTRVALPGLVSAGGGDGYVRKYDRSGAEVWTRQFGTSDDDYSWGVAVNATGIYVTGITRGAFPGRTNAGGWDAFVNRFSENTPLCQGWGATIVGTGAADTLMGTWRDDVVYAGDGDDTVYGRNGNDIICGGEGNDLLYGGAGRDHLDGADGFDVVSGGEGVDQLYGGSGNDTMAGNGGDDTAWGEGGADIIRGWTGTDALDGGPGDDWLYGGPDSDRVDGDLGADTLSGGDHHDQLFGGAGDDTLAGDLGADFLRGGDDNDHLKGWLGSDQLFGDAGDDSLHGSGDDDTLEGGAGDDKLFGGEGTDIASFDNATGPVVVSLLSGIASGDGADTLTSVEDVVGGAFDDHIEGDHGANRLEGGRGADVINGLGGYDELDGERGDDILDGGDGDDIILGRDDNDVLSGGDGSDTLSGGADNDLLSGGAGSDRLIGGDHDDALNGDAGDDVLDGGDGTDTLDGGSDTDECTRGEIYESCEVIV